MVYAHVGTCDLSTPENMFFFWILKTHLLHFFSEVVCHFGGVVRHKYYPIALVFKPLNYLETVVYLVLPLPDDSVAVKHEAVVVFNQSFDCCPLWLFIRSRLHFNV